MKNANIPQKYLAYLKTRVVQVLTLISLCSIYVAKWS